MNKCLNCGKDIKNKYCNVSCQNKHQGSKRADKKYGVHIDFNVICVKCGSGFVVNEREKLHPQKDKYYCSRKCANSRQFSDKTNQLKKEKAILYNKSVGNIIEKKCKKCDNTIITTKYKNKEFCSIKCVNDYFKENKIGLYEYKLKDNTKYEINECKYCNKLYEQLKSKNSIFCSKSCATTYINLNTDRCSKGGKKSAEIQSRNRRSKNEIYFAELCEKEFNNILTNEPKFNGWDADIIIEDLKIAVMWNGKWHYEKITEKHSVKQVQNRDKIKVKEIKNKGYIPYIIKDMGKYDKEFVEKEFNKFKNMLGSNSD